MANASSCDNLMKNGDVDCVKQGWDHHGDDFWRMGCVCLKAMRGSGVWHIHRCLSFSEVRNEKNSALEFVIIETKAFLIQKLIM